MVSGSAGQWISSQWVSGLAGRWSLVKKPLVTAVSRSVASGQQVVTAVLDHDVQCVQSSLLEVEWCGHRQQTGSTIDIEVTSAKQHVVELGVEPDIRVDRS